MPDTVPERVAVRLASNPDDDAEPSLSVSSFLVAMAAKVIRAVRRRSLAASGSSR